MSNPITDPERLAQVFRAEIPHVRAARWWTRSATSRIYVNLADTPLHYAAPCLYVDVTDRTVHLVNWPETATFHRRYGQVPVEVERILSTWP